MSLLTEDFVLECPCWLTILYWKVRSNDADLRSCGLSRAELDRKMPNGAATANIAQAEVGALQSTLVKLGNSIRDRDALKSQMYEVAQQAGEVFLRQIQKEGFAQKDRLTAEGKGALAALRQQVAQNLSLQGPLLDMIVRQNLQFQQAKGSNEVTIQREQFLQSLDAAARLFDEVLQNLKEGGRFYMDVGVKARQLNQTVRDHVDARDLEKRDFLLHMSSMNSSASVYGANGITAQMAQMQTTAPAMGQLVRQSSGNANSLPPPPRQNSGTMALAPPAYGTVASPAPPPAYGAPTNYYPPPANQQMYPQSYPKAPPVMGQVTAQAPPAYGQATSAPAAPASAPAPVLKEQKSGFFGKMFGGKSDSPAPAAPVSAPPAGAVDEGKVQALCAMGFADDAVRAALAKHGGDENMAVQELCSQ
jgi:hypothetical protein